MTEQTQPTDAEIDLLISKHWPAFATVGAFPLKALRNAFREGIFEWGTPAGAGEVVAWVDERAISWLGNSRAHSATITTTLGKAKSSERPMPLHGAPQPTQAQAGAVPTRAFLERTLAAMEGVIDVADRKTDEFDALRSCVIDLTLMLFKPEQPATKQAGAVPLTRKQVKAILTECGYDGASAQHRADFINGLRHGEAAHGIKGADHG